MSSPSPQKKTRPVPEVSGRPFGEVKDLLIAEGFKLTIVGRDRAAWPAFPDKTVIVLATNPAAGTVTESDFLEVTIDLTKDEEAAASKAKAAASKAAGEAAKLATRYTFSCGATYDYSMLKDAYHSLKEVWSGKHYAGSDTCSVTIDGVGIYDHPKLLPNEQAVAEVIAQHGGGGGGSPESDFGRALQLCAKVEADYVDKVIARMDWKKAEAHGALALCPDAPHAVVLKEVTTVVKIGDGTHVVGKDMEAGTYRTKPGSKDCYWSRTSGGGAIIANDFIGFAPDGVTVTVFGGEGFESSRCGVWTKVG